MKKKVVYIPSYYYISHPVFFNIAKSAKGKFHNIYFNTQDPLVAKTNKKGIRSEELKKYFDEYYEVDESLIFFRGEASSKLKIFKKLKDLRNQLENQLNLLNPDAIIATSDMGGYVNRMCNIWAEKNNIPFIIIQPSFLDGIGKKTKTAERIKKKLINKFGYLLFNKVLNIPLFRRQNIFGNERPGNYLFLWGSLWRDTFKKRQKGCKIGKNIYITGNPAFDTILNSKSIENNFDDLEIHNPKNKPIILICTDALDGIVDKKDKRYIENLYINLIKNNPDLYFVIKVHPREDIAYYKKILNDLDESNFTIMKYEDLYSLFRISDVQVSVGSSTSFKAVIFGIPVVLVKTDILSLFDHQKGIFFNNEIELRANTLEELSNRLRRCLTQEYKEEFAIKREKYLESRFGYLNGKSGERVVEKIEEIIKLRSCKKKNSKRN